jgi:DNA primase
MVNELLVNLTNSVLGTGKKTARGNYAYTCPYCNHSKPKLEINFTTNKKGLNPWNCWVCNTKGSRISVLFKKVKADSSKFQELKSLVNSYDYEDTTGVSNEKLELPKEYQKIIGNKDIIAKHAFSYLRARGITEDDIIKYNIGYCEYGTYAKMVIIPSYDEYGNLNYFTGRSFEKEPYVKYRNPSWSRDIVPFELFINWDLPIILCEGPFDAIAIKRNAIPLLGKNIQRSLMKKIVSSNVEKIYLALDTDALNRALEFAETFLDSGKRVYLVELQDKDPSEMGFENFTKLVQNAQSLNYENLFEKKLSLI